MKKIYHIVLTGGPCSGKSTFMKCISGVDAPTSGTVWLNGENLYENYDILKYNIGYVPQDDIVYSNLTLKEMLQYAAKLRMPDNSSKKERMQRINEVLEIVSLSEFQNSYIRQLSGGQRKRASIAVELLADPNLFFLDEPTSGLDPGTERSIMKTLKKMSQMGKTIILVTHNTLNIHLCDKVAFLGEGGKLCFYGTPKEALSFFNVDDFVDIYTLLNENTNLWHETFSQMYNPSQTQNYNINIQPEKRSTLPPKKRSFFKQLSTLIARYIKLISNDYLQLLLLFAQAPLIALLLTVVFNDGIYELYANTKGLLYSMVCSCVWLGLLNAVQEICKERVIFQKEHMADLKISSYLLSKLIVQSFLAFIQAVFIVLIVQAIRGKSQYSLLLDSFWDIQIILFITILSAASLGLFLSSIVKNSTIAMSVVPLLLVPQLLFSGIIFPVEGISDTISNLILSRWTMEGLGSSTNLNALIHPLQVISPKFSVDPEDYYIYSSNIQDLLN